MNHEIVRSGRSLIDRLGLELDAARRVIRSYFSR
jgi:hypothetical protein